MNEKENFLENILAAIQTIPQSELQQIKQALDSTLYIHQRNAEIGKLIRKRYENWQFERNAQESKEIN